MPKGWDAERVIRPSSKKNYVIAAQWSKESYFVIKSDSTNEASFIKFVLELDKNLRTRLGTLVCKKNDTCCKKMSPVAKKRYPLQQQNDTLSNYTF